MREIATVRVKIIIVALIIGLVWRGERIASEEGSGVTPPEVLSLPEGEGRLATEGQFCRLSHDAPVEVLTLEVRPVFVPNIKMDVHGS